MPRLYSRIGSDCGAFVLGQAYYHNDCGLPQDNEQARYWLTKVVDGTCEFETLSAEDKDEAAELLRKIDSEE